MAKRFFDTELMKKDWFQRLPSVYKCFWYFLISECDCVGVWSVNWRLAEFVLGEPIDKEKAVFYLGEQLDFVSDTKIFIKDFCKFQYGELNENCKPHRKYITVLQEYGLLERVLKGYTKGIHTLQEKEEEKEKEKESISELEFKTINTIKEKVVPEKEKKFQPPNIDEISAYCLERSNSVDPEKFRDFYESNGWMVGKNKMKSWHAAIRTWEKSGYNNSNNTRKFGPKPFTPADAKRQAIEIFGENYDG